jgi:hypothetical protein
MRFAVPKAASSLLYVEEYSQAGCARSDLVVVVDSDQNDSSTKGNREDNWDSFKSSVRVMEGDHSESNLGGRKLAATVGQLGRITLARPRRPQTTK